jgi:hypothetical protein
VHDADHARTIGRGKIADVDGPGRVGPRIDVRVGKLQPQRACDKNGQSRPEKRCEHYRHPITITIIVGSRARVV